MGRFIEAQPFPPSVFLATRAPPQRTPRSGIHFTSWAVRGAPASRGVFGCPSARNRARGRKSVPARHVLTGRARRAGRLLLLRLRCACQGDRRHMAPLLDLDATIDSQTASSDERLIEVPPPRAGTLVGGTYRVVRQVGAGAMGAVLLACDETLARRVALKWTRGHLLRPQSREWPL